MWESSLYAPDRESSLCVDVISILCAPRGGVLNPGARDRTGPPPPSEGFGVPSSYIHNNMHSFPRTFKKPCH